MLPTTYDIGWSPGGWILGDFNRITLRPGVMGGKACIRGLRVTVGLIVGQIGAGRTGLAGQGAASRSLSAKTNVGTGVACLSGHDALLRALRVFGFLRGFVLNSF
jgi:hypothetical protein